MAPADTLSSFWLLSTQSLVMNTPFNPPFFWSTFLFCLASISSSWNSSEVFSDHTPQRNEHLSWNPSMKDASSDPCLCGAAVETLKFHTPDNFQEVSDAGLVGPLIATGGASCSSSAISHVKRCPKQQRVERVCKSGGCALRRDVVSSSSLLFLFSYYQLS